jgi:hypothetical protein
LDGRRFKDERGVTLVITSNKGVATNYKVRATVRHQVSINAIIHSHGFPLAQCITRDIGPDGMFIKTEPLRVSKNTVLALEFDLSIGSATKHYRLPVFPGRRTTDRSEEGIQLIFLLHKEDVVRSYENDLNSFISHVDGFPDSDQVDLGKGSSIREIVLSRRGHSAAFEQESENVSFSKHDISISSKLFQLCEIWTNNIAEYSNEVGVCSS